MEGRNGSFRASYFCSSLQGAGFFGSEAMEDQMTSVSSKWVQVAVLGIIVGILGSTSAAERPVIVGDPTQPLTEEMLAVEDPLYVRLLTPSKVELKSHRWF